MFAINGDYYGFRDTGIVIRNGVVYRDEGARDGTGLRTPTGTCEVDDETATTADDARGGRRVEHPVVRPGAAWRTAQVVDGIEDVEVDTNVGNHSIQGEQPRTAVGVIDDNHLVFVVVDGRSPGLQRGRDDERARRRSCTASAPRPRTTSTVAARRR